MFSANLTANDSYTDSLLLFGDLTSMTVNLDVVTEGGSYPSDLMMYIYAADGDCIVWGGWNVLPEPGMHRPRHRYGWGMARRVEHHRRWVLHCYV